MAFLDFLCRSGAGFEYVRRQLPSTPPPGGGRPRLGCRLGRLNGNDRAARSTHISRVSDEQLVGTWWGVNGRLAPLSL